MTTTSAQGRLIVKGGYSLYTETDGIPVADASIHSTHDESEAIARRLAACWNVCEGMDIEVLVVAPSYKAILENHHDLEKLRIAAPAQAVPAAPGQARDAARVFWQQHTQADALSMTMAELHDDVEIVIRAARGAAQAAPVVADVQDEECDVPPFGWRCTREKDHEGPCAAVESPEDKSFVERGMRRIRDAEDAGRYRLLKRGQHWSVIDGAGNTLRAEVLDVAVDAAIAAQQVKQP